MIKRKKCPNCNEKIKKSYNFCSNCGIQLKENTNDWGMLGKSDKFSNINPETIFGGMSGNLLNKMLGGAMKMLEKELQREISKQNPPKTKIKLMINGKEISPKNIDEKDNLKENEKRLPIEFSSENLKKWMTSKKIEPKTKLKRIENRVQYEMEIPGIETIKDISILKLENSLEVRAITKKEAYQKVIPIDLPLRKYTLLKDKLTLELDAS